MRTSAEPLEGNKVKLTVEVDEEQVHQAEDETLRRLAKEVQLPGFRPGHVPRRLLQARLGPKGIREQVLKDALPDYYADAVEEAKLDVINAPEIDITEGEEGGPVVFNAIVEVRPEVAIPGYEGLVVTISRPEANEADIDAQIDRLRDQFATLQEVERPAADGDLVSLDVSGTREGAPAEGLSADDLLYEVGTGGIVDGIDERLVGASAGDTFEMDAEDAPDGPAHLTVTVKQVREKVLPDADDTFAADASEFETIAALREDLKTRADGMKRMQATMEWRQKAMDALVELVTEDPPEVLVAEERERLVQEFIERLHQQQIPLQDYLEAVGQSSDEFLEWITNQAVREVKSDLALRAVARGQDIEPDESDLDEEFVHLSTHTGQSPAEIRDLVERSGRMAGLRSELRKSKAMSWLLEHVAIFDEEGNPVDRESLGPDNPLADGHDHESDEHIDGADESAPHSEET